MAYEFASAANRAITSGASPVSDYPMTLAIWANNITSATTGLLAVDRTGSGSALQFLYLLGGSKNLSLLSGNGSSIAAASVNVAQPSGWYATAGSSIAANSRTAFVSGGNKATSAVSVSISNAYNNVTIGNRYYNGALENSITGTVAEAAIWNVTLSDDEIASLGKGFKAHRIRPQSLVFYAPLIRDLQDTRGGLTLTKSATSPTVADHPRVY